MSEWEDVAKEFDTHDDLSIVCKRMAKEIAKLRTQIGDLVFDHGKQLAEVTKERDEAKALYKGASEQRIRFALKLAASEAREVGLRGALEDVSGEWAAMLHSGALLPEHHAHIDSKITTALATEPPALLGVLKEVESTLSALIFDVDELRNGKLHANLIRTMGGIKALASLRAVIGGGG